MKKIKVFGERNTGTNYLVALLSRNFESAWFRSVVPQKLPFHQYEWIKDLFFAVSKYRNLGWKHACVDLKLIQKYPQKEQLALITLTKNPYSFLLSLYKRPYAYKGTKPDSFEAFLSTPWQVRGRDQFAEAQFETPMHLWNWKNQSYIDLKRQFPAQTEHLTYESLLIDPIGTARKLGDRFQLIQKHSEIINYEKAAKSQGKDAEKDYDYYRSYYLKETWREKLTTDQIRLINAHLEGEVVEYFGYSLIQA